MSVSEGEPPVVIGRTGSLGRITLNRPRVINALSFPMVEAVETQLDRWEEDAAITAVLLDGAGPRGLCAGGDIRAVYEAMRAEDVEPTVAFIAREYRLNARIAAYPKPYVALMHGLTMGGGIGLSAHGSPRLVTPDTQAAMPETTIGLFPDVGGTFLLARAPGELGTHAALTGRRFGPADAIALGLADSMIDAGGRAALEPALAACSSAEAVAAVVARLRVEPPPGTLAGQRAWIDRCYRHDTVEAILAALDEAPEPEAREAARTIRRNSPTSLKITLRALRAARRDPGLAACLEREFAMMTTALHSREFAEGIRAAVIDKDGAPRWRPDRLEDVTPAIVDTYFARRPHRLWPG